MNVRDALLKDMLDAEAKAWKALAGYKFQMFGYWAAIWVHQNQIGQFKRPNPWASIVVTAKATVTRKGYTKR
jgi:hypothetical protein